MTNYEKARNDAFERIAKMANLNRTRSQAIRTIFGMKAAYRLSEYLTNDELIDFEEECINEIEAKIENV